MKRLLKGALLAAGTALAFSAAPAVPAAAATNGTETLSAPSCSWPCRVRTAGRSSSSAVLAGGVFKGVGRVVELAPPMLLASARTTWSSAAAPRTWSARSGTRCHPRSTPHSCLFTGTSQLIWDVTGGTGRSSAARPAASPGRSAPWRFWPATPTASARSPKSRATRWTSSRRAGHCRSETSVAARGLAPGTVVSGWARRGASRVSQLSHGPDRAVPGHGGYSGRPAGR